MCVIATGAGLLVLLLLPTRRLTTTEYRPHLNLPVASYTSKVHYSRGTIEIGLRKDFNWVATGQDGQVKNLEVLLADHASKIHQSGYAPSLRVRIAADAPARHLVECARIAERLAYDRILIASYAGKQEAQQGEDARAGHVPG